MYRIVYKCDTGGPIDRISAVPIVDCGLAGTGGVAYLSNGQTVVSSHHRVQLTVSSLEPSRDAVKVKRVLRSVHGKRPIYIADPPRDGASCGVSVSVGPLPPSVSAP
jgi:hypothetical protein